MSYANEQTKVFVVLEATELDNYYLGQKVAVVSQTTRKPEDFTKIANKLMTMSKEVRVFNTICNATFENQDAASKLAEKSDVMIIVGGKHSSNTKQLYAICKSNCEDSYLIENSDELDYELFNGKLKCGITAGASTPDWVVQNVIENIKSFSK
jgi:4-hydroxy-3-methylbut-2-enyl diphosphate reductase